MLEVERGRALPPSPRPGSPRASAARLLARPRPSWELRAAGAERGRACARAAAGEPSRPRPGWGGGRHPLPASGNLAVGAGPPSRVPRRPGRWRAAAEVGSGLIRGRQSEQGTPCAGTTVLGGGVGWGGGRLEMPPKSELVVKSRFPPKRRGGGPGEEEIVGA